MRGLVPMRMVVKWPIGQVLYGLFGVLLMLGASAWALAAENAVYLLPHSEEGEGYFEVGVSCAEELENCLDKTPALVQVGDLEARPYLLSAGGAVLAGPLLGGPLLRWWHGLVGPRIKVWLSVVGVGVVMGWWYRQRGEAWPEMLLLAHEVEHPQVPSSEHSDGDTSYEGEDGEELSSSPDPSPSSPPPPLAISSREDSRSYRRSRRRKQLPPPQVSSQEESHSSDQVQADSSHNTDTSEPRPPTPGRSLLPSEVPDLAAFLVQMQAQMTAMMDKLEHIEEGVHSLQRVVQDHNDSVEGEVVEPADQSSVEDADVSIYVDGSCSTRSKTGGWAALLVHPKTGTEKLFSGSYTPTTTNRMQIMAAIHGLERLTHKGVSVNVFSKGQSLCSKFHAGWIDDLEANDWKYHRKYADGGGVEEEVPVANQDLWKRLLVLVRTHNVVRFYRVERYAGRYTGAPHFERVRQVASAERKKTQHSQFDEVYHARMEE